MSDIHGNSIALDAVLADVERIGGVDEFWVLGDIVALGHDPVGVVERLRALPAVTFVRGNTDRYVVTGERPPPSTADAMANPDLVAVVAEVAGSFAWTAGRLAAPGMTEWLATLPREHRTALPDGTRVLAVHASPRADDGPGIEPRRTDAELTDLLRGCNADIVFAGHTHRPVDRRVGSVRALNLGSVSNPVPPDLRASYVVVDADVSGHHVQHRRVPYDGEAVIDALERLNHPGKQWLIAHQRGEVD
ncbi:MAG: phosphodiesterase, family [Actinomycetia bacterium]|nr:phosphodiesterase, family [Actinomycetes bacterium]